MRLMFCNGPPVNLAHPDAVRHRHGGVEPPEEYVSLRIFASCVIFHPRLLFPTASKNFCFDISYAVSWSWFASIGAASFIPDIQFDLKDPDAGNQDKLRCADVVVIVWCIYIKQAHMCLLCGVEKATLVNMSAIWSLVRMTVFSNGSSALIRRASQIWAPSLNC